MHKISHLPPWNLAALRDAVERVHNRDLSRLAYECAQSISKRQMYMKYHYAEAKRLVVTELEGIDPEQVLMSYVLPVDTAQYHEFHHRRLQAEASLLALLQCIHATADNLGHVVYYAMNFEADPSRRIQPHRISIHSVLDLLLAGPLKNAIANFIDDPEFKHVAAIVNCSKHRSVISASVSVSFVQDVESHGLRFDGFHYKGGWYSPRWAMQFVTAAFDATQRHLLQVGALLNHELGAAS